MQYFSEISTLAFFRFYLLAKLTLYTFRKNDNNFFDTETTGLPRDYNAPSSKLDNWHRLVQLAWIVSDCDGNVISSENHIIIPNGFEIPSISASIHGIMMV